VIVEQFGDTVVVSFSRPPANAFDLPLVEELAVRLREIGATPPRGGLVVTGRGDRNVDHTMDATRALMLAQRVLPEIGAYPAIERAMTWIVAVRNP
jgi:enoyl-CoA hydratase/carnithine racemase